VPNLVGVFGQGEARDLAAARRIEDAEVDARGVAGEDGEVCA